MHAGKQCIGVIADDIQGIVALAAAMQADRQRIMTEDELLGIAREIGLDADAFNQAYHSPDVEQRVQNAAELTRR